MTFRYMPLALMLATAACSSGGSDEAAKDTATAATEADLQVAAGCQASMDAVGRIYSVLSTQAEGAEKDKMTEMASARQLVATAYREKAKTIGTQLGKSEADVAAAIKAADDAIQAEFEKREFADFATWAGSQADACPPPA